MKLILPWLLALALGAAVAWQWVQVQKQSRELKEARMAAGQLEALRQEFENKQQEYAAVAAEAEQGRKATRDLVRLRNEVVQLRNEKQQMTQQMQTAQKQVQTAEQQALTAQQQAEALRASTVQTTAANAAADPALAAQAAFMKRYGLVQAGEQPPPAAACLNNLRHLEGAKQQWALEHSQPVGAVVNMAALKEYLLEPLVCPAGGTYSLGTVGTPCTCSAPGHALAQATLPQGR